MAGASLGQFTVEEKQGLDAALSREYSELFSKTLEAHRQVLHDQLFQSIPWIDYMGEGV